GGQPAGVAARRAVPGPGAGGRAADLRHAAADPGQRADRAAGGAGREPGAAGGLAPAVPARGADHAGRQAVGRHRGRGRGRLLRAQIHAGRAGERGALMVWVNDVIQGILIGGLYALFACGLSLMFGVMKVVNLAHGDLAVVGGYVAVGVITVTHIPVLWSFVVVVPLMAVLGYVLQRTVIQAALDRSILTTLLVTFGLSVVIE